MKMFQKRFFVLAVSLLFVQSVLAEEKESHKKESTTTEHESVESLSPDEAMKRLAEGNARFRKNQLAHPRQNMARVSETSKGQHPFAVVVTCADSRLSPEIIFDQGIGDLFVLRVAGNIPDDHMLGSVEYAITHLGSRLVMVLGHENCGAVKATLEAGKDIKKLPGHVSSLAKSIAPAVKDDLCEKGDKLQCAVRANVRHVVDGLNKNQPIIGKMAKDEDIVIVGAVYDIETGKVKVLKSETEL